MAGKVYTTQGRALGDRCGREHGGNRRLHAASGGLYQCAGCGTHSRPQEYPDRASALRADRDYRATWPQDTAEAVLAGERR